MAQPAYFQLQALGYRIAHINLEEETDMNLILWLVIGGVIGWVAGDVTVPFGARKPSH